MKNQIQKLFYGNNAKLSALFVLAVFAFVGLGCWGSGGKSGGDSKPIPAAYFGDWKGQDGSTLSIRGDGKGDYRSGGTKVDGGTVEINEADKTLSITFFSMGPTLKIDQPPAGDQMTLNGVVYRREGGLTTSTGPTETSSPTTSKSPTSTTTTSTGDLPSNSEVETLVKETMSDFTDAIQSGDFTNFRAKTSKDFQVTYTASQLKTTFQTFIDKKDQVMPSLSGVDAATGTFTDGPRIRTEKGYKILVANGSFSTRPYPVQFETEYELEKGAWKILKILVKM